jgi:spore germination protein KA
MFQYFKKVFRHLKAQNLNQHPEEPFAERPGFVLSSDIDLNFTKFKEIFGGSNDIIVREITFGQDPQVRGIIMFVDGLVDKATINLSIIKPLMYDLRIIRSEGKYRVDIEQIKNTLLSVGEIKQTPLIDQLVTSCLSGDTILIVDGLTEGYIIGTRAWENRGVQEPQTESVVRGPREGFCETLRINTSLMRRKIKNPDFIMETMEIGKRTKTSVCIAYLKGVINPALIAEIKLRLSRINTDSILESGYIEQFIEDAPYSIFSTVGNSEKPDVIAAKILEGRAAILVDGTPFVLTVPMLLVESFQTAEDYYSRHILASLTRMMRYLSYLITILTPAFYIAILTFHQEVLPTSLMLTLAASEEGLPFPSFFELLIMLITFDILREAGVRLPRPVGQAISIVGALVVGEAAVAAGIVSDFTVIVIAITAVSSFVVAPQVDSATMLRYIYFLLAGFMGGIGISIGLIGTLIHLASLRSFGTPGIRKMFLFALLGGQWVPDRRIWV